MLEEIYDLFKKESLYRKVRVSSVLSYIAYMLIAMIIVMSWINFYYEKVDDIIKLIIEDSTELVIIKFVASAIIAIFISKFIRYVDEFSIFKSKKFKEKLELIFKRKFTKEFKQYYLENDKVKLKEILNNHNVSLSSDIEFMIKRYESLQFKKKANPAILIAIVSLSISTMAFIFGNQIENIDIRAGLIFFIMFVVFFIPLVKASFSGFSGEDISKYKFKEYYISLLTEEYFSIDNVLKNLTSTLDYQKNHFEYVVIFDHKKYYFKSIKQFAVSFSIKSTNRLYKEMKKMQKELIFNYKEKQFFIEKL